MTRKRFHPALVGLHWLLALLMLVELGLGSTFLLSFPNDSLEKLHALRNHMIAGNLILILSVIRFVVRQRTDHPAPPYEGNTLMDRLAVLGHQGLYLLTLAMALTGLALAATAGLPAVVFDGAGSLPNDLSVFGARVAHGLIAKVLIALVAAHIVAALYHQFIRGDGLLSRMWFGKR